MHRRLILSLAATLLVGAAFPLVASADPIHWDTPIEWTPWDKAEAKAKAENKPICLVVYADWCPKCRKMAPLMSDPALLAASKNAVMVLQNDEERPGWLAGRFGASGNYVPRIFFLDKAGAIDTAINSGHPRFPFFYRPNSDGISKLTSSIQTAVTKAGGPAQAAAPQAAAPQAAVPPVAQAPAQAAPAPAAANTTTGDSGPLGSSDLPVLLGLVLFAVGLVWFMSRGDGAESK